MRLATRGDSIEADRRRIVLRGGQIIGYQKLLLATCAQARQLDHDGHGRVFALRQVDDLAPLRAAISATGSLLIVGAGLIGCEVAATARALGVQVTVLHAGPAPLNRTVPLPVSALYHQLHADHGVQIHTGVSTARIEDLRGLSIMATATDG